MQKAQEKEIKLQREGQGEDGQQLQDAVKILIYLVGWGYESAPIQCVWTTHYWGMQVPQPFLFSFCHFASVQCYPPPSPHSPTHSKKKQNPKRMLVMQNNKMHCVCVLGVLFSLIACAGASFTRRFALSAGMLKLQIIYGKTNGQTLLN